MSGNLAGILGNIETHAHLTLRAQIVRFIGLDRSNDAVQRTRVVEVAIDKMEPSMRNVRVFINRIDPSSNEAPHSKLWGITELNFEDFSEAEANPVASYGESSS